MSEQAKAEKKPAGWEEWATRTTAILAVIAALSSGRWGASNLQAILEQGKVNDTWAYYQAKSMKQHDAEQTRDLAGALASGEGPNATGLTTLSARLDKEAKREEKDKLQRETDAKKFEASRDKLVESSFWFELSFSGLQLGVILCTIAAAAKRRAAWFIGIFCGVIGLLLLVNGHHRFYHAPRSWYQGTSEEMAYDVKGARRSESIAHFRRTCFPASFWVWSWLARLSPQTWAL
jgi:hypothetical protein